MESEYIIFSRKVTPDNKMLLNGVVKVWFDDSTVKVEYDKKNITQETALGICNIYFKEIRELLNEIGSPNII